MTIIVKQFGW